MKFSIALCLTLVITAACFCLAAPDTSLANPFTQKSDSAPAQVSGSPGASSPWVQKLIFKQQRLRAIISQEMRRAKSQGTLIPLAVALITALAYGILHSAGPGHGKAVALSYIVSTRPGYLRALAFGNILAFTHGLSGIVLVLAVKWVLHTGFQASLATATLMTQRLSFSLILGLGLWLLFSLIKKRVAPRTEAREDAVPTQAPSGLATAFFMGIIPCPGVVMVMLFAMSMDMTGTGILMALAISTGMALTLSAVTMAGVMGKNTLLSGAARFQATAQWAELILEGLAALALILLGSLFLMATF